MIKSIKTLPSQVSSIEVSDESDIGSLGTEYGVGSTVRVTGQIAAEYILTPDGWMKIAGGGASEPLVLTLVPSSEQNPFSGTFTGATYEEIQSAWSAGRNVIAEFPGVGSMAVNMISSDAAQTNFTYTPGPTTYFARLNIFFNIGRYSVDLFSGLTRVS